MYACYRGEAHVHNIYVYTVGTEQLCADNYSKNAKRAKYVEIVECRAGIEFAGFCEITLISRTHCVSYISEPFFFSLWLRLPSLHLPFLFRLSSSRLSCHPHTQLADIDGGFRASVKVKRESRGPESETRTG